MYSENLYTEQQYKSKWKMGKSEYQIYTLRLEGRGGTFTFIEPSGSVVKTKGPKENEYWHSGRCNEKIM